MKNKEVVEGYYDYYSETYDYHRIGSGNDITIDNQPSDVHKFFSKDSICPFCKQKTKTVFLGFDRVTLGVDLEEAGQVKECENCGWWTYKSHFSEDGGCDDNRHEVVSENKCYAITKKFNVDDKSIPIEVLENELRKKTELVYSIDPYKFEELCTSILKGLYDCEVHHVGKSGDGGKDIIILDSDDPILVQVKRRENPNHTELIKCVREFVGTMYIEGVRKGIYISTAKSFSRACQETQSKLLNERKFEHFEYIDYDKLQTLFKYVGEKKSWRSLVDHFYKKDNTHIYDSDETLKDYRNEDYDIFRWGYR